MVYENGGTVNGVKYFSMSSTGNIEWASWNMLVVYNGKLFSVEYEIAE